MNIENLSIQTEARVPVERSTTRRRHLSDGVLSLSCMLMEMAAIFLAGLAIAHFYVGMHLGDDNYYPLYATPLLATPILAALRFRNKGLYEPAILQQANRAALPVMQSLALIFVGLVVVGFLSGISGAFSRVWFVSWGFASIATVLILRQVTQHVLRQLHTRQIPHSRIALFGDPSSMAKAQAAMSGVDSGVEIVGCFVEEKQSRASHKITGDLQDLIRMSQEHQIDRIVIAKEVAARFDLTRIMTQLSILPSEVLLYPMFLGDAVNLSGVISVNHSNLLRIQKKPISDWGLLVKAIEDKIMAAMGLILCAPLFTLIAIAIKLDSSGPVFFRQRRHGYNQRVIDVWKFRTMTVLENGEDFRQATRNDERVTRVGRFLRKTSLDELPQLINVLKGEMSIVGPRPHPVAMNADFAARLIHYENRHKVKPGITGWAQINGFRGPTDKPILMRKRVEHDLEYIENWSLWLDLKIILATPFVGFVNRNAF